MLGAVDSMLEREQDEDEPLPVLASWRSAILQRLDANKKLSGMPFEQAIKLFEERQILPKEQFDQLRDAAKRKAFTVAGLAAEELLQEAHGELARQIRDSREKTYYDEATGKWVYRGPNLREFDKFAKDRLEKAGWTPANPSHVETVFRTNVMSAYSSGRVVEMTQPAVVALRPYWQIVGVNDSRQRKTHRKAHGTILSVDHPFWRRAYPPFGFGCRCRVISRSKRWVDAHGGPTRVPEGLPDEGFASGIDASLVPTPVAVPGEGQRQPQPAKSAHPIDRPDVLRPIRPPVYRAPPVQVSPTPPELPKTPVAPDPIPEPPSGIQSGKHAATVLIDKRLSKARAATVANAFSPDELDWMASNPVRQLSFRKTLTVSGHAANGSFNWVEDKLTIRAERTKGSFGDVFLPGKCFSVSATRATEAEAVRATVHHELGHRLHMRAPQHIDAYVRIAYSQGNPITAYGSTTHREYFAESYAMYRTEPEVLRANDPIGFNMVRYVLDHWGIPHGSNP